MRYWSSISWAAQVEKWSRITVLFGHASLARSVSLPFWVVLPLLAAEFGFRVLKSICFLLSLKSVLPWRLTSIRLLYLEINKRLRRRGEWQASQYSFPPTWGLVKLDSDSSHDWASSFAIHLVVGPSCQPARPQSYHDDKWNIIHIISNSPEWDSTT